MKMENPVFSLAVVHLQKSLRLVRPMYDLFFIDDNDMYIWPDIKGGHMFILAISLY